MGDAVSLLLQRFPLLPKMVREPLTDEGPYYVYGRLASALVERKDDTEFFTDVCKFVSEIAKTDDPRLKDILIVGFIEAAADDPQLASRMKKQFGPEAKDLLRVVEIELFGRSG